MQTLLLDHIAASQDHVVELQRSLVAIPALGPENGGQGELQKVEHLTQVLQGYGVDRLERIDAPDARVSCGFRPSLAAVIPGQDASRTFWVISHTDVVPAGDLSLWTGDPFTLRVEGDTLIGRGVEDNHAGMVSSLLLVRALQEKSVTPPLNLGLLFVADEETGSRFGLDYVVKERPDLFSDNDLFLVPDFGSPDSSLLEVAEKSMFWLKVTVIGKQCHASTPNAGINTLRAAADFIVRLDELDQLFPAQDSLFDPARSTFEPTKKEANVPNVNTIPGLDVFYVDCRVLPEYELEDVFSFFEKTAQKIEEKHGVRIELEQQIFDQAAPATALDSEIVVKLQAAIKETYQVDAAPKGIGGGTVAAFLRRQGYPAAVWGTCMHNAHQPDEKAFISTQVKDAEVMARMLMAD